MDSSDFLGFTAVVLMFGVPCAVWLVSRVLAHRERMEMLRMGIVPPNPREMRRAMKYGWTPTANAARPNPYPYDNDYYAQHQLRRGVQVACIGMALLIGLGFIGYRDGTFVYGPWLLGGLVPLFVGIAQIIGAVLSGASFGPPAGRERFGSGLGTGSGSQTSDAGSTAPPGPTYGGWRPGPTPEIEKPASPPDYRG
jgi:hypothetical protein